MTIAAFDHLGDDKKRELLRQCCGAAAWVDKMMHSLPAEDLVDLLELAEENWYACTEQDWLEAFAQHARIGEGRSPEQGAGEADAGAWGRSEQSGVQSASQQTLTALAAGNREYEAKFGYIFIVCATGKTAGEMLDILRSRLMNEPGEEIKVAMEEQNQIIKIRLQKLLS